MKLYKYLLALIAIIGNTILESHNNRRPNMGCEFAIIIPSFNNEKYYKENLDSVCWQSSTNPYHIYYINDCSTDSTGELVTEYIQNAGLVDKITLINNITNIGGGANIYNTIHRFIPDHKIVVILDGDDLFPHNEVLTTLEKYYKNPEICLTYGRLQTFPEKKTLGREIPYWIFDFHMIRRYATVGALRTFKAGLFKKIRPEDLMYQNAFMKVTHDTAYMIPMLEMCNWDGMGKKHCVFVKETLYLYRTNSPINDFRIRGTLQAEVGKYIQRLPPYKPLGSLDF